MELSMALQRKDLPGKESTCVDSEKDGHDAGGAEM
jgi:hypothetical protein